MSVVTDKPVTIIKEPVTFNKDVLKSFGHLFNRNEYPTKTPKGVKLSYCVPKIDFDSSGKMTVTISSNGWESKNFTIDIKVDRGTNINIDTEEKAREYSTLTDGKLTIDPYVTKINFKFSTIYLKITSLVLSSLRNLTSIGTGAFWDVTLNQLNLSGLTNLTEICKWSFHGNVLKNLDIWSLKNLAVICEQTFYQYENQSSLESLYLPKKEKLTTICPLAFANNKLKSLDISHISSLSYIGTEAFKGSELKFLNLSRLPKLARFGKHIFNGVKGNITVKIPLDQWKRWSLDKDKARINGCLEIIERK